MNQLINQSMWHQHDDIECFVITSALPYFFHRISRHWKALLLRIELREHVFIDAASLKSMSFLKMQWVLPPDSDDSCSTSSDDDWLSTDGFNDSECGNEKCVLAKETSATETAADMKRACQIRFIVDAANAIRHLMYDLWLLDIGYVQISL